jgi:hypothetical protein
MANKTRLTKELIDAIAERVRVGAFAYVAAQACGIAKSTFYAWMAKGESGGKLYRELVDKVKEASALARSNAELRVFRDKPFEWLRLGPGRTQGEGWTEDPHTVRLEGAHGGPIQVEAADPEREAEKVGALAEMVRAMEQLGYMTMTDFGRQVLTPEPAPARTVEDVPTVEPMRLLTQQPGNGHTV